MRLLLLACALTFAACSADTDAPLVERVETVETTEAAVTPTGVRLDLNTTPEDEFKTISGVGDRMAHEFVEYRPYVSITQFRREMAKYVDADVIAGYEDHVFVPVDPNASDAATLAQLPGLDESEAQMLIDARPFDTQQEFLDALAPLMTADEVDQATAFLSAS
jgi:DNA uptake protein ComE-like DNA-binding protein